MKIAARIKRGFGTKPPRQRVIACSNNTSSKRRRLTSMRRIATFVACVENPRQTNGNLQTRPSNNMRKYVRMRCGINPKIRKTKGRQAWQRCKTCGFFYGNWKIFSSTIQTIEKHSTAHITARHYNGKRSRWAPRWIRLSTHGGQQTSDDTTTPRTQPSWIAGYPSRVLCVFKCCKRVRHVWNVVINFCLCR